MGTMKTHFNFTFGRVVTRNATLRNLLENADLVARSKATVLILGETGTGKELLAREIHARSCRQGRFVAANCGAIPESLIESELFGHVKGAFTGALQAKQGLFSAAAEGTMFLDEIGDMPLRAQANLLRALQEGKSRAVGGLEEIVLKARVITATSSELDEAVVRGLFRKDLLYRLDVIRLVVPPLRERPEDIGPLFDDFMAYFTAEYKKPAPKMTAEALKLLMVFSWPGNVRQLSNVVERLVLTRSDRRVDEHEMNLSLSRPTAIPAASNKVAQGMSVAKCSKDAFAGTLSEYLSSVIAPYEKHYLEHILMRNRGVIGLSAEEAGISRKTLLRKLREHGLEKSQFKLPLRK